VRSTRAGPRERDGDGTGTESGAVACPATWLTGSVPRSPVWPSRRSETRPLAPTVLLPPG